METRNWISHKRRYSLSVEEQLQMTEHLLGREKKVAGKELGGGAFMR